MDREIDHLASFVGQDTRELPRKLLLYLGA
jgi:hypothetical protein